MFGDYEEPAFVWHSTEKTGRVKAASDDAKDDVFYELWIISGSDTSVFREIEDTVYMYFTPPHDGWYDWYVAAYDYAGNRSISGTRSFYIDYTPPEIESTTIWHDTSFTGPFRVTTWAYDDIGIMGVWLFYSFGQETEGFDSVEMHPISHPHTYAAEIPAVSGTTVVNYFIVATDSIPDSPNYAYDPEDSTYHFTVTPAGISEDNSVVTGPSARISPNPTKGSFNLLVTVPHEQIVRVRLFDAAGRKLIDRRIHVSLGTSAIEFKGPFNSGFYFMEVRLADRTIRKKLLILR